MSISEMDVDVKLGDKWEHGMLNLFSMRINLDCGIKLCYQEMPLELMRFKL